MLASPQNPSSYIHLPKKEKTGWNRNNKIQEEEEEKEEGEEEEEEKKEALE